MKFLLLILSFLTVLPGNNLSNSTAIDEEVTTIKVLPQSSLKIQGKTNISKFSCAFEITNIDEPIKVDFEQEKNELKFQNTFLILENDCFDCGNNMMNKDLRKLLKSNEYPHIQLSLKTVQADVFSQFSEVKVDISLAGLTNTYTVPVHIIEEEILTSFKGTLAINIEDFNLKAPRKMLGTVKVSNLIEIEFDLKIQNLDK